MTDSRIDGDELLYVLNTLKDVKSQPSISSYPFIKNVLNQILVPMSVRLIPAGQRLIRCRPHYEFEGFFNNVHEVSYVPDLKLIKGFGRANEPAQSIFYCSNNPNVAFAEVSEVTRTGNDKSEELMTYSVWEVMEDVTVVPIITNPTVFGKNAFYDVMSKEFFELLKRAKSSDAQVIVDYWDFISREFTLNAQGDSSNYLISCAFANHVFENIPEADSILYASTIYQDEGVNIAIKPSVVDKKLKFYSARRFRMTLAPPNQYLETETIDSTVYSTPDGLIKWPKN